MASARLLSAPPRRHSRGTVATGRTGRARRHRARIRWDRVGRIALLLMLGVVVGLYVQHTLAYLSVRSQDEQQRALVRQLLRQNAQLAGEQRTLTDPATIVRDARALGMVRLGEHPYVITGSSGP